jgi:preprotein translocase subunit SecF
MNIIGRTRLWFAISGLLILISLGALGFNFLVHGKIMNFGIDFTGGTLLNLRFTQPVTVAQVREVLHPHGLGGAVIQRSGEKDIYIRTEPMEGEVRQKLVAELGEKYGGVEILEADTIGPVIGKELRNQAILAVIIAAVGILIYISFRFEFIYASAGVIALIHDAIIATGFMAIFWRNIDTAFIAGILTILGYSINDTVVIFDRIRENLKKPGAHKQKFSELVNRSLNETMARSINTVLTVIVMVLSLLILGGETVRDLCLVLLFGLIAGSYSSLFIASPIVVWWETRNRK